MSNIAARSNLYWCAWRWGLSCMMHGVHAARRKRTRCGRDAPAPPRRVHLITIWVVTLYTYSVRGRPPPAPTCPALLYPSPLRQALPTARMPCGDDL